MRLIKLGLISVVVLFGLATAMSLLLPSTVIVSRAIDLNASPASVRNYLTNLENWQNWLDHEAQSTFEINNELRKVTYQNTNITISSSDSNQIVTVWQVGEGRKMQGDFNFITHPGTSVFTLQWAFTQKLKWYPWEKFASVLSDKALGPFMEKSLSNLKAQVEN